MYKPRFMTAFGMTAWFAVSTFGGSEYIYMRNEGCPRAFVSEQHCQEFCDVQNYINHNNE